MAWALSVLIFAMPTTQVIHIHVEAPAKPVEGAPCNGCGVCCLTQPCPLGIVLSGTRTGACAAVRWEDATSRYICGALAEPDAVLQSRLPRWLAWLTKPLSALLPRLAHRWIAAGKGCDSSLQPLAPVSAPVGDNPSTPMPPPQKSALPHD